MRLQLGPVLSGLLVLASTARAEDAPLRTRVDLGGDLEHYAPNYPVVASGFEHHRLGYEGGGFVQVGHALGPAVTLSAGYDVQHQFDLTDHRVNAGAYLSPLPGLALDGHVSFVPGRQFLPRWELRAGVDAQVLPWLAALGTVRHLDYPAAVIQGVPSGHDAVNVLAAGVRVNPLPRLSVSVVGGLAFHTGLTIPGVPTSDTIPVTAYVSGNVEVTPLDPLDLLAGYTHGGESRRPFLPAAVGLIDTFTLGVRWRISPVLAIRVDAAHETFEQEFIRNGISSALTVKF